MQRVKSPLQTIIMKKLTATVSYIVPHWNFCNDDNLTYENKMSKRTCKFCVKGHCVLYDKALAIQDGLVHKTEACKRATAGHGATIDATYTTPIVSPKDIIKQTVDMYSKVLADLLSQGYPRPMAEAAAKKYVMGDD